MNPTDILIIEDEKALREVYEIILANAGYRVATAIDGQEGLKAMRHHRPRFILLDLFMPIMNGLEFMAAITAKERAATTIVVFSNNSDSGALEDASRLGAAKVVLKADVSPGGLVELVSGFVPAPR